MGKKTIVKGNHNVLGNKNKVKTEIHNGLSGQELKTLGEAFASLKEEVLHLDMPEKLKSRAIRAISDAEDETTDQSPDGEAIKDSLNRAKEVLESAGSVYDNARGWGMRLAELGQIMMPYIPVIGNWVANLRSGN